MYAGIAKLGVAERAANGIHEIGVLGVRSKGFAFGHEEILVASLGVRVQHLGACHQPRRGSHPSVRWTIDLGVQMTGEEDVVHRHQTIFAPRVSFLRQISDVFLRVQLFAADHQSPPGSHFPDRLVLLLDDVVADVPDHSCAGKDVGAPLSEPACAMQLGNRNVVVRLVGVERSGVRRIILRGDVCRVH